MDRDATEQEAIEMTAKQWADELKIDEAVARLMVESRSKEALELFAEQNSFSDREWSIVLLIVRHHTPDLLGTREDLK